MDGAMVNIRGEGWKETKTVTVTAVERVTNPASGEEEVHLTHHSYRAGLWEAEEFAKQQWSGICTSTAGGCAMGSSESKAIPLAVAAWKRLAR
jgi:hypothetical protein